MPRSGWRPGGRWHRGQRHTDVLLPRVVHSRKVLRHPTEAVEVVPAEDVLAVDAFSGDAIPLHLLTTQAVAIYRKHLAPGGILAFHISNRHVDLEPAIYLLAQAAGMQARTVHSLEDARKGEFNATWVLVTDNDAFLALPDVASHMRETEQRAGLRLWTDDYSSLLALLR